MKPVESPAQPGQAASPGTPWQRLWPKRVGGRLGLGFGALVLLLLLVLGYAAFPLTVVAQATERFATVDMQRLLRVQALSLHIEGVGSALVRLMNAPRNNRVNEYADVDERNRRIDGIVESLEAELKDARQEDTLQRLRSSRANYAEAFIATVDEIEANDLAAAGRVLNEQLNPAIKAMLQESNQLLNRERERVQAQLESTQHLIEEIIMSAALLSVLVVALASFLAWRTSRSVVEPLAQLESLARKIAGGDYASTALATGTEEVMRVGDALTTMRSAIAVREQEIERLAFRDPLTGLPNRTFLLNSAQSHGASEASASLMLFDLARLQAINETLGFATGDTLIKEVALRAQAELQRAFAESALPLLVHISGGTFAVYANALERQDFERVRQLLADAMAQPVHCSGNRVDLSLSFGLANSAGQSDASIISLLRNAEVALNACKVGSKAFAWYSLDQEAARLSHLSLLSDLRKAVDHAELQMWLQPKFSLQTGLAVGAEALVRWQHPQRGFVSPAEFLPFAEQTGAITLVTDFMLAQGVKALMQWRTAQPHLSLSVNISTRDLQDPLFFQRVQRLLVENDIDPGKLRLEIVESGLMQDANSSIALLHRIRALGVQLSIDDFGTGYSSLAYLQKLPVTELKIDRSFVTDVHANPMGQRLCKSMVDMGHSMGLLVTAEGIETEAERDTLRALGCDVMQGYFGSRPLHGAALQAWLDALPQPAAAA